MRWIVLLTLLGLAVGAFSASAIRSEKDLVWYEGRLGCLKIELGQFRPHEVEVTMVKKTGELVSCSFDKENDCHKCEAEAQGLSAQYSCDALRITVFNVTKSYHDTIVVQGVHPSNISRHYNITVTEATEGNPPLTMDDCNQTDRDNGTNQTVLDNGTNQPDLDNGTIQTDLDNGTNRGGLSTGGIVGVVVGVVVMVLTVVAVAMIARHVCGRRQQDREAGPYKMSNGDPPAVLALLQTGHNEHQDDGFLQNGQAH